jgi:hypothetical protein
MVRQRRKAFDCVQLQDDGALAVHAATAGMTPEQEVSYWTERSAILRRAFDRGSPPRAVRDPGQAAQR